MKDIKGKEIKIGNEAAYAPAGAYAGISLGVVVKFTSKKVAITRDVGGIGRCMSGTDWNNYPSKALYYAYPNQILVINNEQTN